MNTLKPNKNASTDGTCLQGQITTSYATLTKLFGKHHGNDGYKVDAEWSIETPF
jgi:hypothetical protein